MRGVAAALIGLWAVASPLAGRAQPADLAWKTSWAGSVQGPYPVGNPSAQPDQRFAFPDPAAGARDQTFRLVLRPSLWGPRLRLRLSNAFGTRPVTFDGVHVGLQRGSAALVPGTNRPVLFAGGSAVTVAPGGMAWSDPVDLSFVTPAALPLLDGRKLAVSLHVPGESGPMTWHAKALQTSYVTPPGAGAKGAEESEAAFPYATASWFFLDAVDVAAPAATPVVVAFGDSITDGTASTMNGDDRWPDVLARRLAGALGSNGVAVVNAGIGGNQVAGPAAYGPDAPFPGGPAAGQRLDRDVLGLSGVTTLIWLEGINDFSRNGNADVAAVEAGMREGAARLKRAGIRVVGATVTSALGSSSPAHGFPEQDEKRQALNRFIRDSGVFDAVVDFDAATRDPATGRLKAAFVPESTTGGPGDGLHPNRTGYHAMGFAIDPAAILPGAAR
ncbi:GDSL-type esterase/lipase family protein [Methylobacterium sp. JK268]